MGENEIAILKQQFQEKQEELCKEKHSNIDKRLESIEGYQRAITFWLIGIMGTTILSLAIQLYNVRGK